MSDKAEPNENPIVGHAHESRETEHGGDLRPEKPVSGAEPPNDCPEIKPKRRERIAAGLPAIWQTFRYVWGNMGVSQGSKSLIQVNKVYGFDCQSCAWPSPRVLAENDLLPGIGVQELVFGVPHWRVINAAFTYAHPLGSRSSGPNRGAWYAAFEVETSQVEVAFHKTIQLGEIGCFQDEVFYVDYLADFSGEFHDLRNDSVFRDCLAPDSYVRSQALAEELLVAGLLGIVYPSVRHASGTCLACFRPALVSNARHGLSYRFTWSGKSTPMITEHIT